MSAQLIHRVINIRWAINLESNLSDKCALDPADSQMRKRSPALAGKVRLCWRENYGSLPNTHMSLCDGIPHSRAINKCSYCDFILRFSPETAAEGNLWRENRLPADGLWEARVLSTDSFHSFSWRTKTWQTQHNLTYI